jgi:hypothetical protein
MEIMCDHCEDQGNCDLEKGFRETYEKYHSSALTIICTLYTVATEETLERVKQDKFNQIVRTKPYEVS